MSLIHLYMDEDAVERGLIKALRNSNIDVITTLEANRLTYSDEEQLIWANEQKRVIYSFNVKDFCQLHNIFIAEDINHAGIVLGTQQRYSIGEQLRGLLKLIRNKSAEEMINQLIHLGNYIRIE